MTPSSPADKSAKLFEAFIRQKKILIADVSSAARTGMARTLVDLGAITNNITLAPTYEVAENEIKTKKPNVVICDYDLGKQCGLNLLQAQREQNPDSKNCLFVLVTGNTAQSTVAQAAEEDVDTFVLKPYTIEVLRNSLIKAALNKNQPTDYFKKIDEGKILLVEGKIDDAMKVFEEAMGLDPKPALACYYHGQAHFLKEATSMAADSFNKGLNYNKIHYKCMVGLYDLSMKAQKYNEAYDIVKRISRYFPSNPKRLASVLRLAIMTKSYEDVERYYQVFKDLDQRNDEIIRYICAALVVCGKFYLQGGHRSRALELFQKASVTGSGRTKILREIITALVEFDMPSEAEKFLDRFPQDTKRSEDYLSMELLVTDRTIGASSTVEKGRRIIQANIHDPLVYELLIRRSAAAGLEDSSLELLKTAQTRWPAMAEKFDRALAHGQAASPKHKAE